MPAITLQYLSDCGGPAHHLRFAVKHDGETVEYVTWERADILAGPGSMAGAELALQVLVRDFVLNWRVANPSGTINQLRIAIEVRTFRV